MVRAVGNFPRGTDGLTVDEGVGDGELSSRTTGIVDGPGSDIGGNSSSGDEGNIGEVIGTDGRLLDFVGEPISVNEVKESGDLLASIEREMLLGFADGSEVEEGISSVISSSAIGLKLEGIGSGDSEISIHIEEPDLVDGVDLVWLKLPCRECWTELEVRLGNSCAAGTDSRIPADIEGVGTRDLLRSSAGWNDMAGALGLADNIGLKGLGVSGNSCETMGLSADKVASPKEEAVVRLYASRSLELRTILMGIDADLSRLKFLLGCGGV